MAGVPVDVGGGPFGVQGGGQHAVAQGEDKDLMTPTTPAAAWVWPRLDLAEPSSRGRSAGAALAVGGEQRLRLDGVAERGAGAVRLDGVDLGGGEPGVGQGGEDDALLGQAVGGGETVGGAVLVDGAAAHDREHGVVVAAGVGQAFHDEDVGALGPAGAVGVVGERLAAAVAGETALAGEENSPNAPGLDMTVTPPTTAREHSPDRRDWAARWRATREEEQAVSTVTAGPSRPRV
ncbi:hypothetical protein SALBM217S_06631 [Streptomyces griseoloalbus]